MIESNFSGNLFGKTIDITIYDIEGVLAKDLWTDIYNEALRLQKIFNLFDESSELSLLNKNRSLKVSKDLLNVIKKAIKYCKLTEGEYDITLGKNILARKKGLQETHLTCSYKDIKIKNNQIILENTDAMIDLGSIAKGYITEMLADYMKKFGIKEGLIDSRGDMIVFGKREIIIDVQDPRDKDRSISKVKIKNESIATSGDYNQFYGRYENSHILNQKDLISVSVISKKLDDADVFASVIFLLPRSKREAFLKKNQQIKALTIDNNKHIKTYNGFEQIK